MQIYLPIAELSISIWMLVAMGFAVGILSGIFGIGGGFILTPILILIGVPPWVAVGTGTSLVVASSISSALGHWQRGNIDTRLGTVLLAGGIVGTWLGIRLQQLLVSYGQLDAGISIIYVFVLGTIGSIMLIEGLRAWRALVTAAKAGVPAPRRKSGRHHMWAQALPLRMRFPKSKLYMSTIPITIVGAFVGALTAIMGVGGGFVLVPALIYLIGVSTRIAIGTSLFMVVFITIITTMLQAVQNQTVDILLGGILMVSGAIGAQYGLTIGEKLNAEQLRAFLGFLVLAVAIRMAAGLLLPPGDLFVLTNG
jgi:uncharacterized membrane protein YfcA